MLFKPKRNLRSLLHPIITMVSCEMSALSWAQETAEEPLLETIIVSASRGDQTGQTVTANWSLVDQDSIERLAPQHSNQIFNRVAGTWVSRGNGQESLIAMRSPVLTGAGSCGARLPHTSKSASSSRLRSNCVATQEEHLFRVASAIRSDMSKP